MERDAQSPRMGRIPCPGRLSSRRLAGVRPRVCGRVAARVRPPLPAGEPPGAAGCGRPRRGPHRACSRCGPDRDSGRGHGPGGPCSPMPPRPADGAGAGSRGGPRGAVRRRCPDPAWAAPGRVPARRRVPDGPGGERPGPYGRGGGSGRSAWALSSSRAVQVASGRWYSGCRVRRVTRAPARPSVARSRLAA